MNNQKLIEKYFNNELSKEEFKQLEEFLESDEQLKDEFFNELEIKRHISKEKHSSLKNRLKELDTKSKKKFHWLPYAAAVVLLIGIASFIYNSQSNHQKLFTENFEIYPNVISPITRGELTQETTEAEAFKLYKQGNYAESTKAFSKAYKETPKDYLLFYKSVSLLAQNKTRESIRTLESYDWEKNHSDFSSDANWYLGLAHLKQNQSKQAQFYFEKVANSESHLSNQAKKILKNIN